MKKYFVLAFSLYAFAINAQNYFSTTTSSTSSTFDVSHLGTLTLGSTFNTFNDPWRSAAGSVLEMYRTTGNISMMLGNSYGRLSFNIANHNGAFHPDAIAGDAVIRKHSGRNIFINLNNTANNGANAIVLGDNLNKNTLNVLNNGRVGVGISAPSAKLHLYDNTSKTEIFLGQLAANDKAGIVKYLQGNGSGTGVLQFGNWGDNLSTNGLNIKKAGNVGIGTTNPKQKLSVKGNLSIGNSETNDNSWGEFILKKVSAAVNYASFGFSEGTSTNNTNVESALNIQRTGNVGIGTTSPLSELDVRGNINLNNQYSSVANYLNPGYYVYKSGSVSYGMKLQYTSGEYGTMIFGPNQSSRFISFGKVGDELKDNKMIEYMRVDLDNGKVGIGTKNPDEALTVKGKIHAEEVKVDLNVAPDFVFQKYYTGFSSLNNEYIMPTLEEVEAFTKNNHHLPDVPSAKEIKEEGLNLKQMTALLLQKVEELTLYTIEQEKRIKELENKLSSKNNKK